MSEPRAHPQDPGRVGRLSLRHPLCGRNTGSRRRARLADWLVVDQEHAPIGAENLHAMIAATAGTACSPWVRVPKRDEAFVKPALDAASRGDHVSPNTHCGRGGRMCRSHPLSSAGTSRMGTIHRAFTLGRRTF